MLPKTLVLQIKIFLGIPEQALVFLILTFEAEKQPLFLDLDDHVDSDEGGSLEAEVDGVAALQDVDQISKGRRMLDVDRGRFDATLGNLKFHCPVTN